MTAPLHIINGLIARMGYQTYLEIGVRQSEKNFDLVTAKLKHGIDINPDAHATFTMTSDAFFEGGHGLPAYDLIYVDGDHRELPSLRDLAHAVDRLTPNGTVVCDNILPWDVDSTRPTANCDAWKSFAYLRMSRPDLWMCALDIPFGLGVIRDGRQALFVPQETRYHVFQRDPAVDFYFYLHYRDRLMNVVSESDFWKLAEGWPK